MNMNERTIETKRRRSLLLALSLLLPSVLLHAQEASDGTASDCVSLATDLGRAGGDLKSLATDCVSPATDLGRARSDSVRRTPCAGMTPSVPQDRSATIARQQTGDLVTWLQGMCDYTVYEGNHQGRWADADQLIFSIDGQSYRQNAFYLNGFRVNNRTTSGSTLYPALFEHYSTSIDPATAKVGFQGDMDFGQADYARVSGNFGGLGGVNPTTEALIRTMHGTGTDDLYKGFGADSRQHVRGAGSVDAVFSTKHSRNYVSAAYGNRRLPQYDHNGLLPSAPLFGANNYRVQAFGEFSAPGSMKYGYLANVSGKDDGFSEFYLNRGEMPRVENYSASVYAVNLRNCFAQWTTGLTWATTSVKHDDVGFSRSTALPLGFAKNIIDQDGESLEPWMPDGLTHELSWSFAGNWMYSQRNWPRLSLHVNAYNSLIAERPTSQTWSNSVYLQHPGQLAPLPLYRYDWTSRAYAGALLENEVVGSIEHHWNYGSLHTRRGLSHDEVLTIAGRLGVSVDGMLMSGGSKVTPVPVGSLEVSWCPAHWVNLRAVLSHDRMKYDMETLRFMSDRYMNADVYSVGPSATADEVLFTQSGGAHHSYKKGLWQPSYLSLIIPVTFRFGREQRHEIALIQSYRKFYHMWMPQYAGGAAAQGYYVTMPLTPEVQEGVRNPEPSIDVYYLHPGRREYVVGYMPEGTLGSGFLTATPYYINQQTRYSYHGRKVEFGLSWQSMQGVGYTGLGNGPGSNNVGVLSESMANPNTHFVMQKRSTGGRPNLYPAAGRTDQDRAYIVRIALSYNINKHLQIGGIGNWVDGQPFSYYRLYCNTEGTLPGGGTLSEAAAQYAVVPACPRGINPTDGNFGSRESGIFHIEVFGRAGWEAWGRHLQLELRSYNIYDFGNVLNEFCFPQAIREGRGPNMALTIPRGIIASLKVGL